MIKRLVKYFIFSTGIFLCSASLIYAQSEQDYSNYSSFQGTNNTNNMYGLSNNQGIAVGGANQGTRNGSLIDVIKRFINWVLGILSLIVLIICLYGGFLMVTAAGNDSQYKKGFTILKQAGMGLVIIGLSWFIVSIIFRIIGGVQPGSGGSGGGGGGGN